MLPSLLSLWELSSWWLAISLGRAYIYSTPAYAWIKLPYEILQALFGVICGPFLVWKWKLDEMVKKMIDGKY